MERKKEKKNQKKIYRIEKGSDNSTLKLMLIEKVWNKMMGQKAKENTPFIISLKQIDW